MWVGGGLDLDWETVRERERERKEEARDSQITGSSISEGEGESVTFGFEDMVVVERGRGFVDVLFGDEADALLARENL